MSKELDLAVKEISWNDLSIFKKKKRRLVRHWELLIIKGLLVDHQFCDQFHPKFCTFERKVTSYSDSQLER